MGNSQSSILPSFNATAYTNLAYGFASMLEPLGPHAQMLRAVLLALENAQENKSSFESVGQRAGRLASIITADLHHDVSPNDNIHLNKELEELYRLLCSIRDFSIVQGNRPLWKRFFWRRHDANQVKALCEELHQLLDEFYLKSHIEARQHHCIVEHMDHRLQQLLDLFIHGQANVQPHDAI